MESSHRLSNFHFQISSFLLPLDLSHIPLRPNAATTDVFIRI